MADEELEESKPSNDKKAEKEAKKAAKKAEKEAKKLRKKPIKKIGVNLTTKSQAAVKYPQFF